MLFTPVCDSVHMGGCMAVTPRQTPPGRRPPRQTPPSKTPSLADTPLPGHTPSPWADTPLGRQPPPPETATVADGTHPTGMHSC